MATDKIEDGIQHGIDDDPNNDAQKGAVLGGVGGMAVGAAAGAAAGPIGAVIGAAVGGIAGAVASGAAVAAVDSVDNDDNVSGLGHDVTRENRGADYDDEMDDDLGTDRTLVGSGAPAAGTTAHNYSTGYQTASATGETLTGDPRPISTQTAGPVEGALGGNQMPGIQTGGRAIDGTTDTRGIVEKTADAVTGDHVDDKTGKPVY